MEMTAIRASSLPELFDCPARWEAKHLCGRRLPRSAAAQLGDGGPRRGRGLRRPAYPGQPHHAR